jgi:hypothetical protein
MTITVPADEWLPDEHDVPDQLEPYPQFCAASGSGASVRLQAETSDIASTAMSMRIPRQSSAAIVGAAIRGMKPHGE